MVSSTLTTVSFGSQKSIISQSLTSSIVVYPTVSSDTLERPENILDMFKWWDKPPYLDEYPVFQKPPPETPIIFENLQDWDRFKARYQNRYKYGIEMKDLENELPPPYKPRENGS